MANADCIVIQGSNMAEAHPVGFQWVMEAKRRGATIIHVDPRFTRTSALADLHVPIRAGSDIAFLGGLINHVLTTDSYFHEYVRAYTNASTIIGEEFLDTEDLAGLNPAQILAWTGTREERPDLWRSLREAGVEVQFGTLGAEGRRLDDVYAADGDVSEYRDLFRQGVTVIATDTPLAVKSVLGAEVAKAAACERGG